MNTIIPETMQGFMECFGEDCLNMMRDLSAQGDTDAQELLEKVEGRHERQHSPCRPSPSE